MNKILRLLTLLFCMFCAGYFVRANAAVPAERLVKAALSIENPDIRYDSAYRTIAYPMGDVPAQVGVCTDVVIRAYRKVGIDLQKRVHEDMKQHFSSYPKIWGLVRPDRNIDHRRVPNLRVFFKRHGQSFPVSEDAARYVPGDIVTWNVANWWRQAIKGKKNIPHIGIVTDQRSSDGERPLIMHNIGGGQVLEDMLFDYQITGHYRYAIK